MKKIIYFILAIITILYIGLLCYANIAPNEPTWIMYISIYGGLTIALAYAVVNFVGSPLKIAFLIILIIAVARGASVLMSVTYLDNYIICYSGRVNNQDYLKNFIELDLENREKVLDYISSLEDCIDWKKVENNLDIIKEKLLNETNEKEMELM